MTQINAAQLVLKAAHYGDVAYRAQQVRQDPAVQKAWSEAGSECRRGTQVARDRCLRDPRPVAPYRHHRRSRLHRRPSRLVVPVCWVDLVVGVPS
jgi:hypothetical protein